ncbi:MAG TPA: hypothetical protein VFZ86_10630 [Thermoleophilia bacterium]|nr:hypothetical protein [Thermoleophilia bacterium]
MNRDHDELVDEHRDRELGAALAALPHPELPDDMDARLRAALEVEHRRRRGRRSIATLGLAATLAAIALASAALAGAFDSSSPAPWPEPPLPAESVYPTNAAGETYGANKPLVERPDLMAAVNRQGVHGYIRRSDMEPPPGSPEEAEQANKDSLRGYTIPLYEADGVTQIGVFQVGGPGSGSGGTMADGTKFEQTSDEDGNIITTTTHPDGSVTIATEALDGTVTTQELTAAEAKRLRQETAATPKPTTTPTRGPDKPRDWLLRRMSQLARDAGDAHATAWWELQSRYYLKPIEGDKTPESPYQQWASVWLVILHGDFAGGDWRYWLLDQDSHNVLSSGQSDTRFVMSGPQLPPPQGPITLGGE